METKTATIKRSEESTSLILKVNDQTIEIILTEDNPNKVKSAFNHLIRELKKGCFSFELKDDASDLYHDICVEYLKQLNSELKTVYDEMKDFDVLEIVANNNTNSECND